MTDTVPVPAHLLPHRTPAQLIVTARRGLAESEQTTAPGLRYAAAHLAALRAAAAMLAARARPDTGRRRQRVPSVWALLATVAPELAEWAAHFANTGEKRAAAEAGIPRAVTAAEVDAMLAAAEQFVTLIEDVLGLQVRP